MLARETRFLNVLEPSIGHPLFAIFATFILLPNICLLPRASVGDCLVTSTTSGRASGADGFEAEDRDYLGLILRAFSSSFGDTMFGGTVTRKLEGKWADKVTPAHR